MRRFIIVLLVLMLAVPAFAELPGAIKLDDFLEDYAKNVKGFGILIDTKNKTDMRFIYKFDEVTLFSSIKDELYTAFLSIEEPDKMDFFEVMSFISPFLYHDTTTQTILDEVKPKSELILCANEGKKYILSDSYTAFVKDGSVVVEYRIEKLNGDK